MAIKSNAAKREAGKVSAKDMTAKEKRAYERVCRKWGAVANEAEALYRGSGDPHDGYPLKGEKWMLKHAERFASLVRDAIAAQKVVDSMK